MPGECLPLEILESTQTGLRSNISRLETHCVSLYCYHISYFKNQRPISIFCTYSSLFLPIGIVFLYPPSHDSVVQVTEQAFKSCSISDPILYMKDGNSLFNITSTGKYYFTSGAAGHCQKGQKLEVLVGVGSYDESSLSPASSPPLAPGASPSYANAFGSIPTSSSASLGKTWDLIVFVVGFATALVAGI